MKVEGATPVASRPDAHSVTPPDVPGSPVPAVATSDAQAMVPQEAPAPSSVPGEIDPGPASGRPGETPNAPPKQQALKPEGAQEQPLGVRDHEPARVAPGSESQVQAPNEATSSSTPTGEKEPTQVSAKSQAPKPTKWEPIDLDKHESLDGEYHTIKKHVAKGFEFLQDRLKIEHWIPRASTYIDKRQANAAAQMVIDKCAEAIEKWLADPKSIDQLPFNFTPQVGSREHVPIGFILERDASRLTSGNGARVVLRKDMSMPNGFRIVTSYPIP